MAWLSRLSARCLPANAVSCMSEAGRTWCHRTRERPRGVIAPRVAGCNGVRYGAMCAGCVRCGTYICASRARGAQLEARSSAHYDRASGARGGRTQVGDYIISDRMLAGTCLELSAVSRTIEGRGRAVRMFGSREPSCVWSVRLEQVHHPPYKMRLSLMTTHSSAGCAGIVHSARKAGTCRKVGQSRIRRVSNLTSHPRCQRVYTSSLAQAGPAGCSISKHICWATSAGVVAANGCLKAMCATSAVRTVGLVECRRERMEV